MNGKELYNLYEAYLDVYEGKVPWDDPNYPLQSGWTPAEKNRAKRERTGVEDPNTPQHNISDKDMTRYGAMKNVDDTETEKAPKGKKTLFGKKPPEHKNLHQFKKFPIKSNKGKEQTIGNVRRSRGTPKPGATDDKSNMYQSPIKRDDKRTRGGRLDQWKGPNPRNEEIDSYDIILSHLLDEGYVETPEAAEVIMVNMSEEWRDSILLEKKRQYDVYASFLLLLY